MSDTKKSEELEGLMERFKDCWLPQSGDTIGMSDEEFTEEFEPDNFMVDLEAIVQKALEEGKSSLCEFLEM